jgi:hypothetical protein
VLKEIISEIVDDFFEKLKTPKGALVALCVAVWLGIMVLAPSPPFHPSWMSRDTDQKLAAAMKEFCSELYPTSTCPRISSGGKSNLSHNARFTSREAPSLDSVANVLKRKGWVFGAATDVRTTTYCRAGLAATYSTHEAGIWVWVAFSSVHRLCDRSRVYAARQ